ncbi:iron-sulfur cluster carrier protein ApbC [Teredinibacter haidensis]|uniref:iron-sulfur cluster carrier protein ApbC n=1 Tax=Teredinibacter haidensis TaxID=2731755 RepID=UPI000948BE68|nr:iron-sulfur cluster carrier protein ApbC [Teredinibacter haidensis]
MSSDLMQQVDSALTAVVLPEIGGQSLRAICELSAHENGVRILVNQGVHDDELTRRIQSDIARALSPLDQERVEVGFNIAVLPAKSLQAANVSSVPGVKNIVAVASGKGGVGKSTTTVNIALALALAGAKVGVLDADIYGPSQPQMLGVADKRPEMHGPNMIEPIDALGLKMISMGNLVTDKTPMVWRGPMVSGALQQLLQSTHWDDIDYLVIDMPPGTGDIQLTLSQAVPVSGSVIVTTPQDIALLDARKGIEMFTKVNIPVFGIVENMSTHICSNCGHAEAIFGEAGGEALADEYGVSVLGRLPLTLAIREQTDAGTPPVVADPDSAVSKEYRSIASHVALALWQQSLAGNAGPEISFSDD